MKNIKQNVDVNYNTVIANKKNYGLIDPLIKTISGIIDFREIKTIYDIGARDALQSIEFSDAFPSASIFAFEANPESIPTCLKNINGFKNIKLFELAISNISGQIPFFAADMVNSRDKNIGISSMFRLHDNTPYNWHWVQKKIQVQSDTIDNLINGGLPSPDLIWIDIQGAEFLAFQGAKTALENVKVIFTEAGKIPYYHGHGMFDTINDFLLNSGFKNILEIPGHEYESDFLYIKNGYY